VRDITRDLHGVITAIISSSSLRMPSRKSNDVLARRNTVLILSDICYEWRRSYWSSLPCWSFLQMIASPSASASRRLLSLEMRKPFNFVNVHKIIVQLIKIMSYRTLIRLWVSAAAETNTGICPLTRFKLNLTTSYIWIIAACVF